MYPTSNKYKQLVYQAATKHLLNIYIDNNRIDDKILDFKVSFPLFSSDEVCLGSVVSQSIEFKIHKSSLPSTYKKIYIETGIQNEVIPLGYFNFEEIKEDENTVTIKALDNMIKFESKYNGSTLTYPATMLQVLQDICSKAGVELRFYILSKSK